MSFSKTVSEWKGYGIIIDNGLLFYLVLLPNLGDIKRMVKRDDFFSSEVFTLWEKRSMYVLHKLFETLRSRQAQLWQNFLFKGQFACQKKSVFFMQLLEPASFAVINLTDAPVLCKEQICISAASDARTKETVTFQELKAIKALANALMSKKRNGSEGTGQALMEKGGWLMETQKRPWS